MIRSFREAGELLVELVEAGSGIDVQQQRVITPQAHGVEWYYQAYELAVRFSQPEYDGLLKPLIQAYPNAHHFHYIRGLAKVRHGQWREAERDFTLSLAKLPEKSGVWHDLAYHLAFLYLFLGDIDQYRALCKKTLEDFGSTDDPWLADRTGEMSVLSRDSSVDLNRAEALIDLAMTHKDHELFPYFSCAKAIALYRRGEPSNALGYLEPAETHDELHLQARALCFKALCLKKAEEPELALQALTDAERIIKSDTYPQPESDDAWTGWLAVQLAYREAVMEIRWSPIAPRS